MKKITCTISFLLFVFSLTLNAQSKKWSLEDCVTYALENNISIQQTELDSQTAIIDKKQAFGSFFPSFNAAASHS